MLYRVGDWDDLQIDLHVSLHDGFKIQLAGIVPVFSEFNGSAKLQSSQFHSRNSINLAFFLLVELDLLGGGRVVISNSLYVMFNSLEEFPITFTAIHL